jgi:hypothetical protein
MSERYFNGITPFHVIKEALNQHLHEMLDDVDVLFRVDVEPDTIWETYLESFPPGTNNHFRERREYDCSGCQKFIKQFGNVVSLKNNEIISIWDFKVDDPTFQLVVDTLLNLIQGARIHEVFLTQEAVVGTPQNQEILEDGRVLIWEHFHHNLPLKFVQDKNASLGRMGGEGQTRRSLLERSLNEIASSAVEVVLDLIADNSLERGDSMKWMVEEFQAIQETYRETPEEDRDNFLWAVSASEINPAIVGIKNKAIGVLLTNLTEGMPVTMAVSKFENEIVSAENYQRSSGTYSMFQIRRAEKFVEEHGLANSLLRRFAVIEDVTVDNVLWANRSARSIMEGVDVFRDLQKDIPQKAPSFERLEEVPVDRFISEILPRTREMEVFFEAKLASHLTSLIGPVHKESPTLFQWENPYCLAYRGNLASASIKDEVKAQGGRVEGALRFSIQWNEDGDNSNDFDAHAREPGGTHIWYHNLGDSRFGHPSSGRLDIDWIHPKPEESPVENIIWTRQTSMPFGSYELWVEVYTDRGGRSGFRGEIEFENITHYFNYTGPVHEKKKIKVATIQNKRNGSFQMTSHLPMTTTSGRQIFGLPVEQFVPVSMCMFSPNFWDQQTGHGHKHLCFMVDGCINNTNPNGFYNEYLRSEFREHRQVFEVLGSRMKVDSSDKQLSGLGFPMTTRSAVVCRLKGELSRVIKIIF